MVWTYLRLEGKRAWKRFLPVMAGAALLLILLGASACLFSRVLYGDAAFRRIQAGIILPEEDALAKRAVSMLQTLDSVESLCDLSYVSRREGEQGLSDRSFDVLVEVPDGFIQDIMSGENTPLRILIPAGATAEGKLFQELIGAGARNLAAAQAGIYAGNRLCVEYELSAEIGNLEEELNRIFLSISFSRGDWFRWRQVRATKDLELLPFYGVSAFVLFLQFLVIPASGYLEEFNQGMKQRLKLGGVGSVWWVIGRCLGLMELLLVPASLVVSFFCWKGFMEAGIAALAALVLLVCLGVSAFSLFLYRLAASQLGGVLLLFFVGTGQHFLAGGFLPEIFLPDTLRHLSAWMPSSAWLEAGRMAITGSYQAESWLLLAAWVVVGLGLSWLLEGTR